RISNSNRNHSNIDQALKSLARATEALENSQISPQLWKSYLWGFYAHLARSAAVKGDKKAFQELLHRAAELRGSRKFQLKCFVATTAATVIGLDLTAAVIERILSFRSAESSKGL